MVGSAIEAVGVAVTSVHPCALFQLGRPPRQRSPSGPEADRRRSPPVARLRRRCAARDRNDKGSALVLGRGVVVEGKFPSP